VPDPFALCWGLAQFAESSEQIVPDPLLCPEQHLSLSLCLFVLFVATPVCLRPPAAPPFSATSVSSCKTIGSPLKEAPRAARQRPLGADRSLPTRIHSRSNGELHFLATTDRANHPRFALHTVRGFGCAQRQAGLQVT
jgi:hypothetical protein